MAEKKKFFDVKLEILNSILQLFSSKPEDLLGRVIKFDLTKILKGKNCEAKFIVKKQDDSLVAEMFEFNIYPSYIRRLISHNISIVEDSFSIKAQDVTLRIKPFLITRKRVHRSVRKALKEEARDFLAKNLADKTREKIFQSILTALLQKQLSKKLKKIYPLAVCELRVVKVEKTK